MRGSGDDDARGGERGYKFSVAMGSNTIFRYIAYNGDLARVIDRGER